MAVDYRINLAKALTSSVEQRKRFRAGMLLYLLLCAIALLVAAFFSSINLSSFIDSRFERNNLVVTTTAVTGLRSDDFKNPDAVLKDLQAHSDELASLRLALGQRVKLLPVIENLFMDLPNGVKLQNLTATKEKISFAMNMPPSSTEGASDLVSKLKKKWEKNEELTKRVVSIRPVKGQRRTVGSESVFNVQFECVLKK